MAKWGEGDPRWIVEERNDATNVNNWHWTEKNASIWSKDKLRELLLELKMEGSVGSCRITEVESLEGEATINNRKGKLIFFYEWDIKLKWRGTVEGGSSDIKGTIKIPNLSEENSMDEVDVSVEAEESDDDSYKLKEFIRLTGAEIIRERLQTYLDLLKTEFTSGMILSKTSGEVKTNVGNTVYKPAPPVKDTRQTVGVSGNKSELGVKLQTKNIKLSENFKCRAVELYNVFTVKEMVQAFTHGNADIDAQEGGEFRMLAGNITGNFVNLLPGRKIIQKWRHKTWPTGHFSTVTLDFTENEDSTTLDMKQVDVPSGEVDRTNEGWKNYYFNSIKRTFGFGASLY